MPHVSQILEKKEILPFLKRRGLLRQYRKAKRYLLNGDTLRVRFKERNPKGIGIWYFRINRQFRALCSFDESNDLIVFAIDNHQN